jgi:hypothetical protein
MCAPGRSDIHQRQGNPVLGAKRLIAGARYRGRLGALLPAHVRLGQLDALLRHREAGVAERRHERRRDYLGLQSDVGKGVAEAVRVDAGQSALLRIALDDPLGVPVINRLAVARAEKGPAE